MPFDKGTESMKGASTTETEDRIRHWADKGYQAMAKDLPGTGTGTTTTMIPYKRSKTPHADCRTKGAQQLQDQ